jgi:lipopolysaccharide/colanic/teichoic acid biosynthesis glycosyltransferase
VPHYAALIPAELRAQVWSVRPGITDPVSLKFADESAVLAAQPDPERHYVEVLLPAKAREAAAYAAQATLWSDLRLIGRTLRWLLSSR